MIEYTVLEYKNVTLLIEKVNEKIKQGWEPLGGVAMSEDGWYSQAMVYRSLYLVADATEVMCEEFFGHDEFNR